MGFDFGVHQHGGLGHAHARGLAAVGLHVDFTQAVAVEAKGLGQLLGTGAEGGHGVGLGLFLHFGFALVGQGEGQVAHGHALDLGGGLGDAGKVAALQQHFGTALPAHDFAAVAVVARVHADVAAAHLQGVALGLGFGAAQGGVQCFLQLLLHLLCLTAIVRGGEGDGQPVLGHLHAGRCRQLHHVAWLIGQGVRRKSGANACQQSAGSYIFRLFFHGEIL